MVNVTTINISRLVLSVLAVLAIGSGMSIIGMGYEIKRHTPYEAVQIVLFIIGVLVLIAQIASFLTMFLVAPLLYIYFGTEALSLLSTFIVVICVKARENDVLNSVAKLPEPGMESQVSAERLALRHHTHKTLEWGVPILIISIILQVGVFVLVGITWYLAQNEGTPEERRARAETARAKRVDRLKADVQMSTRNTLYKANKNDNEVLRAHMEKTYGQYTHGDAWKKEERKKRFFFF